LQHAWLLLSLYAPAQPYSQGGCAVVSVRGAFWAASPVVGRGLGAQSHLIESASTSASFLEDRSLPMIFLSDDVSIIALLLAFLPAFYYQSIHLEELTNDSLPLGRTSQHQSMYRSQVLALQLSCMFLVLRLGLPFDSSLSSEVVHTFNICSSF
jgi:hypothetical protein